ncbi:CAZyme family AA3 [Trichoderma aggressivum f. europaeum]|uniref:CAZyme family AA3 n=1 Tax=Trichoderma aggressivum f. europaeum TaxID=173218 RepID=A0AAE1J9V3_9HYPO|nr:CAZyme family AA3 [Trichoderma aggressivum f. europaeum]
MASPGFTKAAVLTLALYGLSNGLPQSSSNNEFHKRDPDPIVLPTYDYVVVGSGPGGGPVAARLALAGYKVLLMDAGDDEGNMLLQEIPLLSLQSTEFPPQEWDYFVQHYDNQTLGQTDPKFTWELPDGSKFVGINPPAGAKPLGILYPRAGTLGGCAGHNVMITTTPQASDWETVESITGDNSWSPDLMKQYWERAEDNLYLPNGTSGHGFNGWLETSLAQLDIFLGDNRIMNIVRAAATVVGNEISSMSTAYQQWLTADVNSDSPTRDFTEGLFRVPEAVKQPNWDRSGPRDLILQVANAVNSDGSRKYHLDVRLESLVTKIRFDQSGPVPKAVGVDFLAGQSLYSADPRYSAAKAPTGKGSVNVTREVIISTGTFNTPQLLKLSGVGPAAELKSFDIPVIVDLPGVGTGMSDRYEVTIVQESTQNFEVFNGCTFLQTQDDSCLLRWENNHTSPGIYSSNGIVFGIPKKSSVASPDTADLLMAGLPANFHGYFPGYSKEAFADAQHFAILVLKAHSRNYAGTVTLLSNNPQDTPHINFHSFQNGGDEDVQAVYDGIKLIREIYGNLSSVDNTWTETIPGSDVQTEEQIKDFIRREAWGHHTCCTARIGADDDSTAVLDSKFRVRGTTGLRVVDASVFPEIPGYFIVSAIYTISEKAADVIIADAKASS